MMGTVEFITAKHDGAARPTAGALKLLCRMCSAITRSIGLRPTMKMREIVAWFIHSNFELGKEIGEYAATSPREAWAAGFEEQQTRPPYQWHEYTRLQAKLLAPWRLKKHLMRRIRDVILRAGI
jgi:hypothetical protein